jgi:hypothetical protein
MQERINNEADIYRNVVDKINSPHVLFAFRNCIHLTQSVLDGSSVADIWKPAIKYYLNT